MFKKNEQKSLFLLNYKQIHKTFWFFYIIQSLLNFKILKKNE